MTSTKIPHPFLKWAGGKRQLLSQIDEFLPKSITHYIEPFVGGGALFFHLLPKKAILIDTNPVLINVYQVIKNNVEELIHLLKQHRNEKDYFYQIRNIDRTKEYDKWTDIEKASRTIFLNRCCFNGLYRVNSKGQFNVPFGKYKNPKFCDEINLHAVHDSLQDVTILSSSFKRVLDYAKPGTFIYLDPPYHPLTETANFTSYTKENFGKEDQIHLKEVFSELDKRGCKVMLSNSYCDFIIDLYKEYNIKIVKAKRAINSKASKRGAINEALILNY
ncbi:MAG: DNA adenine methylase [Promethearchaeota archaeon]